MPPKHSPNSGRKRLTFCESCKIIPIPIKKCLPCKALYQRIRAENPAIKKIINEKRKIHASKNKDFENQRKSKWREKNKEYNKNLHYKKRYGEYASARREVVKIKRLIKEIEKNEKK